MIKEKQMNKNKKLANMAMLVALAMIFSYVESLIPINFGIPGMKLGVANLVTEDNKNTEENDWEFGDTGAGEDGMVRLFINIGKKQRVRPGDILGAIAGESGMDGKLIGTIDMYDKYTFVEVPREYAREVLNAMKNVKIKGKTVAVEPANQK